MMYVHIKKTKEISGKNCHTKEKKKIVRLISCD